MKKPDLLSTFCVRYALLTGVAIVLLILGGYAYWTSRVAPHPTTEVFKGVHYTALDMEAEGYYGEGLAHIARVDLTTPGIELFTTPVDPRALKAGYQYRLRYTWQMAWQQNLAVVVNGTLFRTPTKAYWPYRYAHGHHTVISDGELSHLNPSSYLLWFEEDHTPHLTDTRPVPDDVLQRAQWGMGGLVRELRDGNVHARERDSKTNRYTMIAINQETMTFWMASFDATTRGTAARILADQGARDGIVLDGGGSTAFYMSRRAHNASGGLRLGGARPVATHIGVRAQPVER